MRSSSGRWRGGSNASALGGTRASVLVWSRRAAKAERKRARLGTKSRKPVSYGGSSLAEQVAPIATGRELDILLTAGERISMALLAMAIESLGQEARSLAPTAARARARGFFAADAAGAEHGDFGAALASGA